MFLSWKGGLGLLNCHRFNHAISQVIYRTIVVNESPNQSCIACSNNLSGKKNKNSFFWESDELVTLLLARSLPVHASIDLWLEKEYRSPHGLQISKLPAYYFR